MNTTTKYLFARFLVLCDGPKPLADRLADDYAAARMSGASECEAMRDALYTHDDEGETVPVSVPDHLEETRDTLLTDLDAYLQLCDEVEACERAAGWDPNP